jgi:hypothetical protein
MRKSTILILILIMAALFVSGYSLTSIHSDSDRSHSRYSFSEDVRYEKDSCPYLQQKKNSSCPYLSGSKEKPGTSCPYLSGDSNYPHLNNENKKEGCPYLNEDYNERTNSKEIRKTIINTST